MNVISVAGPDKVSLCMFIDFMKFCLGARYSVGSLHSLMPQESMIKYLDEFLNAHPQSIISFYSRRKKNIGPGVIPLGLQEVSDAVIWFDLYATEPRVIKDECGFSELFLDRWRKNIQRLNNIKP